MKIYKILHNIYKHLLCARQSSGTGDAIVIKTKMFHDFCILVGGGGTQKINK